MKALDEQIAAARNGNRIWLRAEQATFRAATRAEKTGEVAAEFDGIHDIHRAVEVGSVDGVHPGRPVAAGDHCRDRGARFVRWLVPERRSRDSCQT
jgi:hypothetical protein